jgi:hypothetical protein
MCKREAGAWTLKLARQFAVVGVRGPGSHYSHPSDLGLFLHVSRSISNIMPVNVLGLMEC